MPIKIAEINSSKKAINSNPILNATSNEYVIAVITPVHSSNLFNF